MPGAIALCVAFAAAVMALVPGPSAQELARSTERKDAAVGRGGRLEGSINLGPRLSSKKMRFNLYPDAMAATSTKNERVGFGDEMQNVVVYLESTSPSAPAPQRRGAPIVMEQRNLSFVPHLLAIPKGTTVEFPNSDPIFHNVFSLAKAASFDLGRYPQGSSKSVRFDEPGIVKVFCHIHSDMSAVIIVLDNPFFATPGQNGRFVIDGIAPGEYRAVGWHERARPVHRTVRIEPGKATTIDFTIPLSDTVDGG